MRQLVPDIWVNKQTQWVLLFIVLLVAVSQTVRYAVSPDTTSTVVSITLFLLMVVSSFLAGHISALRQRKRNRNKAT